jgi:tetratricopeptide (TPR) repeat protein
MESRTGRAIELQAISVTEDQGMGQVEQWLDEAVRQHESGKLDEAAPLFERVLRLDPGHAGALYHLGKLELARANPAVGAELLRQAAVRNPNAVQVHQSLGVAYKTLGEWGIDVDFSAPDTARKLLQLLGDADEEVVAAAAHLCSRQRIPGAGR